jgi:hypothetical protein
MDLAYQTARDQSRTEYGRHGMCYVCALPWDEIYPKGWTKEIWDKNIRLNLVCGLCVLQNENKSKHQ